MRPLAAQAPPPTGLVRPCPLQVPSDCPDRRVESGISGSIREYQEPRSGMGVSGVPDIRESGPTEYPGYLRDIRDIRNKDLRDGGIRFSP